MKIIKMLPMLFWAFLGKQVKSDYKSKFKERDKPKVLRRRYLGLASTLIGTAVAGGTVLASGETITPQLLMGHLSRLSDAGIEIYHIVEGVWPSILFVWGAILMAGGQIFKK